MKYIEYLEWVLVACSVCGVVLNIHRHRACYWVWAGTNAGWICVGLAYGVFSLVAMQGMYLCLSIWGISKWSKK